MIVVFVLEGDLDSFGLVGQQCTVGQFVEKPYARFLPIEELSLEKLGRDESVCVRARVGCSATEEQSER